jgi:hypothetical protein
MKKMKSEQAVLPNPCLEEEEEEEEEIQYASSNVSLVIATKKSLNML